MRYALADGDNKIHRRRIKTEEKTKVIAAVWGTEFCTRTILKNRMNTSYSSNHPGAIFPILQIILVQNI